MKIYGYLVITNQNDYHLVQTYLKKRTGIEGYYWSYDGYTLIKENIVGELKKCDGYLIRSSYDADLNQTKLISECTNEELDLYIKGRR